MNIKSLRFLWTLLAVNILMLLLLGMFAPYGGKVFEDKQVLVKLPLWGTLVVLAVLIIKHTFSSGALDKPQKVNCVGGIILAGFLLCASFHYLMRSWGYRYPYDTFVFGANDRFMDFFNILRGCWDLDPYNPDRITCIGGYPPFAYLLGWLFSLIKPWIIPFLAFELTAIVVLWLGHRKYLSIENAPSGANAMSLMVLTCLSYPVLFALDRANFDLLMFMLATLFLVFYQKGRPYLAAVALALSMATKIYTAVFLLLLLADRKYRATVLAVLLTVGLTALALAMMKDGFSANVDKFLVATRRAQQIGIEQGSILRFSSALYTLLFVVFQPIYPQFSADSALRAWYSLGSLAVIVATTVHILWTKPVLWKRVCLLTVLVILLPYSSGDYRLILMFLPVWLFANEAPSTLDAWYAVLFGLIMIPKNFDVLQEDRNIGMIINPLLLVAMLVLLFFKGKPVEPSSRQREFMMDATPQQSS